MWCLAFLNSREYLVRNTSEFMNPYVIPMAFGFPDTGALRAFKFDIQLKF